MSAPPPHGTPERYRELGCRCQHCRRTHCGNGHEFTPENTRMSRSGLQVGRQCRKCGAADSARARKMNRRKAGH